MALRTRKQTGKRTNLQSYDINVYNNLLKNIAGKVEGQYETYFKQIEGADSIHFAFSKSIVELKTLLEDLFNKYSLMTYKKKGFEWVDNFQLVKDKSLISDLENLLIGKINSKDPDICLSYPESLHQEYPIFYGFQGIPQYDKSTSRFPELDIETQLYGINFKADKDNIRFVSVFTVNAGTSQMTFQRKLHQCVYGEVTYKSNEYFIESGSWYKVDKRFISQIEANINSVVSSSTPVPLQYDYRQIASRATKGKLNKEKVFNDDLTKLLNKLGTAELLDCELVDKIEVCDVLYYDGSKYFLFHNKYKYGSSALSHLFSQGYVSAQLLTQQQFRVKSNGVISASLLKFPTTSDIERRNYVVKYGIISKKTKKGDFTLPLFSKINLDMYIKNMKTLGYQLEIVFFEVI